MSTALSSPADLDISTPQGKDYLQAAISERGNPFRGFDWGDHLITPPAKALPGLIASSKPYWSSLPFKGWIFNSVSAKAPNVWNDTIMAEVLALADASRLPFKSIWTMRKTRGVDATAFDVISIGIDVCRQVDKADAEAFVIRCSELLASRQAENAVVEVHYNTYWGSLAER